MFVTQSRIASFTASFSVCWPDVPILPYRVFTSVPLSVISQNLFELPSLNSKNNFKKQTPLKKSVLF